jgi:hypothetical protein
MYGIFLLQNKKSLQMPLALLFFLLSDESGRRGVLYIFQS